MVSPGRAFIVEIVSRTTHLSSIRGHKPGADKGWIFKG
jgi:hypothetical protein